jgi:acid phosphatase (class A)
MRSKNIATALVAISVCAMGGAQEKPAKGAAAVSKSAYYIDTSVLRVELLVQPPPAQDSALTKAELAEVHRVEQTRTPEQVAAAQADDKEEDIFSYRDVMGDGFAAESLPVTAAFSAHVHNEESVVGNPLKKKFKRLRPYQFDSSLHPVCALNAEATSYPSGHALSGYLLAFSLVEMVPEKSQQILARADAYAHNRIVCGVHYPSDVETSRRIALAVFGYMMANPRFQMELAAARTETRQRLGLPATTPQP